MKKSDGSEIRTHNFRVTNLRQAQTHPFKKCVHKIWAWDETFGIEKFPECYRVAIKSFL